MRRNSTALYAGISWLKQRNNWNSFLILLGFEPDMQSHMQHIEDKHKEKQVCNSITSTTHTIQTQPWNWIKVSLLLIQSVHGCSSQVLCSALLALNANAQNNLNAHLPLMLQWYKGGCLYSVFPLESKTIKSTINSYLIALKTIKCLPIYNTIQVRSAMNAFIQMTAQQLSKGFKKIYVLALSSCSSLPSTLARLMMS